MSTPWPIWWECPTCKTMHPEPTESVLTFDCDRCAGQPHYLAYNIWMGPSASWSPRR